MVVYRIEHPFDGKGFWKSGRSKKHRFHNEHSSIAKIQFRHDDMEIFPNYECDQELQRQISFKDLKDYKFAFNSIKHLREAFTKKELKECVDLGFVILKLNVKEYFSSIYQTVYKNPVKITDISNKII